MRRHVVRAKLAEGEFELFGEEAEWFAFFEHAVQDFGLGPDGRGAVAVDNADGDGDVVVVEAVAHEVDYGAEVFGENLMLRLADHGHGECVVVCTAGRARFENVVQRDGRRVDRGIGRPRNGHRGVGVWLFAHLATRGSGRRSGCCARRCVGSGRAALANGDARADAAHSRCARLRSGGGTGRGGHGRPRRWRGGRGCGLRSRCGGPLGRGLLRGGGGLCRFLGGERLEFQPLSFAVFISGRGAGRLAQFYERQLDQELLVARRAIVQVGGVAEVHGLIEHSRRAFRRQRRHLLPVVVVGFKQFERLGVAGHDEVAEVVAQAAEKEVVVETLVANLLVDEQRVCNVAAQKGFEQAVVVGRVENVQILDCRGVGDVVEARCGHLVEDG